MATKRIAKNENQSTLAFVRASKVRLSKDKKWLLVFVGNAVITLHKNYVASIFANKNQKRSA